MAAMETDIRGELKKDFELVAEWRRHKAVAASDDPRNEEAAELLEKLASSIKDADLEVIRALWELFEGPPDVEEYRQLMCEVGFHSSPATAEEFCRNFIAARTGG
jgi:hypothetical protein